MVKTLIVGGRALQYIGGIARRGPRDELCQELDRQRAAIGAPPIKDGAFGFRFFKWLPQLRLKPFPRFHVMWLCFFAEVSAWPL